MYYNVLDEIDFKVKQKHRLKMRVKSPKEFGNGEEYTKIEKRIDMTCRICQGIVPYYLVLERFNEEREQTYIHNYTDENFNDNQCFLMHVSDRYVEDS
jgi:hypothetical protein